MRKIVGGLLVSSPLVLLFILMAAGEGVVFAALVYLSIAGMFLAVLAGLALLDE